MFYDAVQVGGEPDKAGYRASQFATKISTLRADRKTTSAPFLWLCIAMHVAIVALLVFIVEIITMFGKLVGVAEKGMPDISNAPSIGAFTSFNFSGLQLMHRFVIPLVIVFTVADALAPSIVDGANKYKFLYNLGITTVISGTSLIFLPKLAGMMFKSVEI
jgi:flagellar protein FlaJ